MTLKVTGVLGLVGIYHTVAQFCQVAASIEHPFARLRQLEVDALRAFFELLVRGLDAIKQERQQKLAYYLSRRKAFERDEEVLKARVLEDRWKVMQEKQVVLLREVLRCGVAGQLLNRYAIQRDRFSEEVHQLL